MPKIAVNGIKVNYEMAGQGPIVVMNHGLGSNLEFLRPAVERLKGDFTLLTWDHRGCGESEAGGPYSLKGFSEDLYGLMRALEIDRAIIYGVSWGGVLSQRFTLDHPDMVRALIIDSSSSEANERAAEGWLARGRAMLEGKVEEALPAPPPDVPKGKGLGGFALNAAADQKVDPQAFMGLCQAVAGLHKAPMTPELERIACPTFVLVGDNDIVAGVGGSVIIHRHIPGSKLLIVPDCGHAVLNNRPDVFDREFRAFVAGLPA